MVWGEKSFEGHTDLHVIVKSTQTAVGYWDEALKAIVRPFLGFLLVQDIAQPHWPECVGSSLMMKALMPLTGPLVPLT